jgi:hypothetical protein
MGNHRLAVQRKLPKAVMQEAILPALAHSRAWRSRLHRPLALRGFASLRSCSAVANVERCHQIFNSGVVLDMDRKLTLAERLQASANLPLARLAYASARRAHCAALRGLGSHSAPENPINQMKGLVPAGPKHLDEGLEMLF